MENRRFMKIPRTATGAAAAAASCQRHEAAAQKRRAAADAARFEASEQLNYVIESDLRLSRQKCQRWEDLNGWMTQKAFAMRADCSRITLQEPLKFIGEFKSWDKVLPVDVTQYETSVAALTRYSLEISPEALFMARQHPQMRNDMITHISLTFAQHCLAALLEADGNKAEADQIRAKLERRPE